MLTVKEQQLFDALVPAASQNGIEIVTVEIVGSKKAPTIRIYLDCEGGIGFDELSASQSWINEIMDRIDPFPGAYTLEVSSPGIDRPLRSIEHFQRFCGERVKVVLTKPLNGRSKFKGTLVKVCGNTIEIDDGSTLHSIPFELIRKANLIAMTELDKKKG